MNEYAREMLDNVDFVRGYLDELIDCPETHSWEVAAVCMMALERIAQACSKDEQSLFSAWLREAALYHDPPTRDADGFIKTNRTGGSVGSARHAYFSMLRDKWIYVHDHAILYQETSS